MTKDEAKRSESGSGFGAGAAELADVDDIE